MIFWKAKPQMPEHRANSKRRPNTASGAISTDTPRKPSLVRGRYIQKSFWPVNSQETKRTSPADLLPDLQGLFLTRLSTAGIDRERCYVTNTVKHFKFTQGGKRRLHSKPNAGEVQRCSWWLGSEVKLIEPRIVVALVATAAACLVGSSVRITKDRGTIFRSENLPPMLVTLHPSHILRIRDQSTANAERMKFVHDLNRLRGGLV